jgi:hypothetical protein
VMECARVCASKRLMKSGCESVSRIRGRGRCDWCGRRQRGVRRVKWAVGGGRWAVEG